MNKNKTTVIAGIDVSKDKVDVFVSGRHWQVSQSHLDDLVKELKTFKLDWVILEPTGGYEWFLVKALNEADIRVARPHVSRVSHHAKGRKSQGTKTDKIDAEMLAHYGECYIDELQDYCPDEQAQLLRCLFQRRLQLVDMRSQEKNRFHHKEVPEEILQTMEKTIAYFTTQIEAIENRLRALIESDAQLNEKHQLLQSMTGVGELVSIGLIALLPELGKVSRKHIGALVGVVPIVRNSGKYRGKACIRGGRFEVRSLMYMAALSSMRYCPRMKAFSQRLKGRGKSGKQAAVACIHKMLRILNTMVKQGQHYQPLQMKS